MENPETTSTSSSTSTNRVEDPNLRAARDHARTAREEMRRTIQSFLPAGVVTHQRAARREFLLAVRSLINAAIDRMERENQVDQRT